MSAPSSLDISASSLPWVTCLCPTYGRFQLLRLSVACFLAQDYPNKRLLILNDATIPLTHGAMFPGVHVLNLEGLFENLGHKRQALLELAPPPQSAIENQKSKMLCAHWDDDDLYLPWHLSRSVAALLAHPEAHCVKSRGAWYLVGVPPSLEARGIHHNVFEGSMVFDRQCALDHGGYPPTHSGQARVLMNCFRLAGQLYEIPDAEGPVSYVYRWSQGVGHVSALGNKADTLQRFAAANQDFGDGALLTPADLSPYWEAILRDAFKGRLRGL